jgi:hypothetical protein
VNDIDAAEPGPPVPLARWSAAEPSALAATITSIVLKGRCFTTHYGSANIRIAAQVLAWIEPVRAFSVSWAAFFELVTIIPISVAVTTTAPWLG